MFILVLFITTVPYQYLIVPHIFRVIEYSSENNTTYINNTCNIWDKKRVRRYYVSFRIMTLYILNMLNLCFKIQGFYKKVQQNNQFSSLKSLKKLNYYTLVSHVLNMI